jgi:hypothetical protein
VRECRSRSDYGFAAGDDYDRKEDEVLLQGVRMRVDAAYASMPQERRPQGEWARKYRLMVCAGKRHYH